MRAGDFLGINFFFSIFFVFFFLYFLFLRVILGQNLSSKIMILGNSNFLCYPKMVKICVVQFMAQQKMQCIDIQNIVHFRKFLKVKYYIEVFMLEKFVYGEMYREMINFNSTKIWGESRRRILVKCIEKWLILIPPKLGANPEKNFGVAPEYSRVSLLAVTLWLKIGMLLEIVLFWCSIIKITELLWQNLQLQFLETSMQLQKVKQAVVLKFFALFGKKF
eukprot:TRINITY_DN13640_c1_g1_i4.p2 TRINITY_DN13640_c1_g1~~TRINITY_DN13640_c1_g1_i4.p2  ORF type:complete len:220 (-),score=9.28 TRINITY_DN13640_c1_g1_i4:370-1029(-)